MSEYIGWLDNEWNTVLDHNQPIVRCRDCRYFDGKRWCDSNENFVEPDGFCKWGEPK